MLLLARFLKPLLLRYECRKIKNKSRKRKRGESIQRRLRTALLSLLVRTFIALRFFVYISFSFLSCNACGGRLQESSLPGRARNVAPNPTFSAVPSARTNEPLHAGVSPAHCNLCVRGGKCTLAAAFLASCHFHGTGRDPVASSAAARLQDAAPLNINNGWLDYISAPFLLTPSVSFFYIIAFSFFNT